MMREIKLLLTLTVLSLIDADIYIYNTIDGSSVELYDCILYETLFYCRRPTEPITLNRSDDQMQCYHNGTAHLFSELRKKNVSISTVLHQWNSTIEKAEQYLRYTRNSSKSDGYVCECTDPASFGKNCEYSLPMGTTFAEALTYVNSMKNKHPQDVQQYGGIICYTTLECDSGLLCLDWREICDGVQQCMSGLDEENCDKLEFNECESDEYRCMNGMCIPEEFFLDGDFDCLDWSDEIQYYEDKDCANEVANTLCDDRICPPNRFSCGDGQCIKDRFEFQTKSKVRSECQSRRDQYFICETQWAQRMWTLSNGRCYEEDKNEELNTNNRTVEEQCQYLFRCVVSGNLGKQCHCVAACIEELRNVCNSSYIQYPTAGIMAPYVLFFYYLNESLSSISLQPDYILVNGTVKCAGSLITIPGVQFSYNSMHRVVENAICRWAKNESALNNSVYHHNCHYQSLTFSNRSYNATDICSESEKCISTYRIKDGINNCLNDMDEKENISVPSVCSDIQRYRFRCSPDEPTCLSVTALGKTRSRCKNRFDQYWLGTSTEIKNINCNKQRRDECAILRQYIENSWTWNRTNQTAVERRIPFRHYCDTFWNLLSKEDENPSECRDWWICPTTQWQCNSGQCIDKRWVLDGEWDCSDASDEDSPFDRPMTDRNLQLIPRSELEKIFNTSYTSVPLSTICNLTTEFPCFPIRLSNPLANLIHNRPCISRDRIGDGQTDCYGAIDERNAITDCTRSTMLGFNFKCNSSNQCIPYETHCKDGRCSTASDDGFWCNLQQNSSICESSSDSVCFNGTCLKGSRCNGISDCLHGEDEYMCEYQTPSKSIDGFYRESKEIVAKNTAHELQLIQSSTDTTITTSPHVLTSPFILPPDELTLPLILPPDELTLPPILPPDELTLPLILPPDEPTLPPILPPDELTTPPILLPDELTTPPSTPIKSIVYQCNKGVGVTLNNGSFACFCPPQYYGNKCQFHTDRITVLLHLKLSQSNYSINSDIKMVLKLVVLFLFENEIITNQVFHVRPGAVLFNNSKNLIHFVYSRSFRFLQHKKQRYFNQSNIIHDHPYSIRIEMYERSDYEVPVLNAVWKYPIYFDYLPVFRLAKVLRLAQLNSKQNLCSSNPCNQNQDCRQLINDNSSYICLCKSNFTGENCAIPDQQCIGGYCAFGSLCKPNYRGLLVGNAFPFCVCPFNRLGEQCDIEHDKCQPNPCQNNGSCFPSSKPGNSTCFCTQEYRGAKCELKKSEVKLYINESVDHAAAVVQIFDIDFVTLDLLLARQEVHRTLPKLIEYRHGRNSVPEVILVKLYSDQLKYVAQVYLISLNINVSAINETTQVIEKNRCDHVVTFISSSKTEAISNYSPIKYHHLCRNNTSLKCFRDDFYLCVCDEAHSRVECFRYHHKLDQCSDCLAGGLCLKGDQSKPNDFICLCPPCYYGTRCEFNGNSFVYNLDQLFFVDLTSSKQNTTMCVLIIGSLLLALIALVNNVFSFATFRRQKCLCNGVGQYLYCLSIINQISLSVLAARLIHLSITITSSQVNLTVDNILCKLLSYLLTCSTRVAYWLVSFVATERVYTAVFLKGQWLKKPYVARRLIALAFCIVFLSGAYELAFMKSIISINKDNIRSSMCTIDFPMAVQSIWMIIHQIVSITNFILPFLINLCCTATIIKVIIKSKMNILNPNKCDEAKADASNTNTNVLELQENVHVDKFEKNVKIKEKHYRLNLLRDVLNDNKEILSRPAISLIPSIFSLFSVPLFISLFSMGCQNLESNRMRYPLIVFYFISFIPQMITFFLYVYPSSLYYNEWRSTKIGQWMTTLRQGKPSPSTIVLSTTKEQTLKNISEAIEH